MGDICSNCGNEFDIVCNCLITNVPRQPLIEFGTCAENLSSSVSIDVTVGNINVDQIAKGFCNAINKWRDSQILIDTCNCEEDICGYCGEPEADKYALWVGGGIYWPGEFVPDTELVHSWCEQAETLRAFNALSKEERDRFLRSIR